MKCKAEFNKCGKYNRLKAIDWALRIVQEDLTIRELAELIDVSKSTIHYNIHKYVDGELRSMVDEVFSEHFDTKHIRGGMATKKKYSKEKSNL